MSLYPVEVYGDNLTQLAKEFATPNYSSINTEELTKMGGWIEIVDGNKIVYVIGEKKDEITEYSPANLKNYISDSPEAPPKYLMGIATFKSKSKKELTCIVKAPNQFEDLSTFSGILKSMGEGLVVALIFFILSNSILVFYFHRMIARPLRKINKALHEMSTTNSEIQLDFKSIHEIETIRDSFNEMSTKLKASQKETAEITASKNQMIQNLTHDLQTPVTSIMGYSKLLYTDENIEEEKKRTYLSYIYNKSIRVDYLIKNLLVYAKLENPTYFMNKRNYDVTSFIRETVILHYHEIEKKDMEIELNLPEEKMMAHIDYYELERALGNLIINAIKYNPPNTKITITLERTEDNMIIFLEDNGVGISDNHLKGIFNEFTREDESRNSEGGSGLGLYISKKIVELHGGEISIESTVGEGTTFKMTLPK